MKKAIMLRNSISVSDEKVVEYSTFSYVYVDDPETMPVDESPSGTTVFFPIRTKEGLMGMIENYKAKTEGCRFAVVQTNPDGLHLMIVRGVDKLSAVQNAVYMVLFLFGEFLNAEVLLKESRYECDGIVWRVLPYEYNQTLLI